MENVRSIPLASPPVIKSSCRAIFLPYRSSDMLNMNAFDGSWHSAREDAGLGIRETRS